MGDTAERFGEDLDDIEYGDTGECPVNDVHKFREHDDSPAGPSRAWYCEHCGEPAPIYDADGFAVPRPPRVPTP